eukprot:CAMPEP_0202889688 /NCGR_PEP_ID=MMETSP1392-20130828/281_1 /ASSEMBLY_ACC=CAM_ASM_000868 /TAXON_ID=225041 /ORGANISM="Chlamydomonas chlamydogama, Strain SAG 11-48b" /LENGTH=202 /DNA_ID=CAMNT_0049573077 /DNA_START=119 /DNA_END=727 /DNA_ORIENTATION=+
MCSARSAFSGRQMAFSASRVAPKVTVSRVLVPAVQAGKVCDLTGKKRNKANSVCFSNKKHRYFQDPNLQNKKVYWAYGQRWVHLKVCTKAIKTLEKKGLDSMAAEAGIDLWKLPFDDARPERLQYLAENKGKVPVAANPRAMKNAEKLAASKKKPRVPVYTITGAIAWVKPGSEALYTTEAEVAVTPIEDEQDQQLKVTLTQ